SSASWPLAKVWSSTAHMTSAATKLTPSGRNSCDLNGSRCHIRSILTGISGICSFHLFPAAYESKNQRVTMQDSAKPATRILIVDDHPVVLSGCRTLFASDQSIRIDEASDAKSGHRAYISKRPDVTVIDINL